MQYIDLSILIGVLFAVTFAVLLVKVWPLIRVFIPPAALAVINWLADIVVRAVEAEYGSGNGDVKHQEAIKKVQDALSPLIKYLNKHGFTLDVGYIYDAVQAAWKKLDLQQKLSGEKEAEFNLVVTADTKNPDADAGEPPVPLVAAEHDPIQNE